MFRRSQTQGVRAKSHVTKTRLQWGWERDELREGMGKVANAMMGAMERRAYKRAQGWNEKERPPLKDTPGDKAAGLRDCRPGGPHDTHKSVGRKRQFEGRGGRGYFMWDLLS